MQDKPKGFPTTQPNGEPLKPITEVLLNRRATNHFTDEPVPDEYLGSYFTTRRASSLGL